MEEDAAVARGRLVELPVVVDVAELEREAVVAERLARGDAAHVGAGDLQRGAFGREHAVGIDVPRALRTQPRVPVAADVAVLQQADRLRDGTGFGVVGNVRRAGASARRADREEE